MRVVVAVCALLATAAVAQAGDALETKVDMLKQKLKAPVDAKAAFIKEKVGKGAFTDITFGGPPANLICAFDSATGFVVGLKFNDDKFVCGGSAAYEDTDAVAIALGGDRVVTKVDVATDLKTGLIAHLKFHIATATAGRVVPGGPTEVVTCGGGGKGLALEASVHAPKLSDGRQWLEGAYALCKTAYAPPLPAPDDGDTPPPADPAPPLVEVPNAIDPPSLVFEYTPRTCKDVVYCVDGTTVSAPRDSGCTDAQTPDGAEAWYVDLATNTPTQTVPCPPAAGPPGDETYGVIVIEPGENATECVPNYSCANSPPAPTPAPTTPTPTTSPPTPTPGPTTPTPTTPAPVPARTYEEQLIEQGYCQATRNGPQSPCVASPSDCGPDAVAGPNVFGTCPAGGTCCYDRRSLCSCPSSSQGDPLNCGNYANEQTCMCVETAGNYIENACGKGCKENGCNSVFGKSTYTCVVTCRKQGCHRKVPTPANAQCPVRRLYD